MWIKSGTKKELAEAIQQRRRPPASELRRVASLDDLTSTDKDLLFIYADDSAESAYLPSVILVKESQRRDFLAWMYTYVPNMRPLTAHIRVATTDVASHEPFPRISPCLDRLEGSCLGLILAEALAHTEGRTDLLRLSPMACAGTFSFGLARSVALNLRGAHPETVHSAWQDARELLGQPRLRLTQRDLTLPWRIVLALLSRESPLFASDVAEAPSQVLDACIDLYRHGEVSQDAWSAVIGTRSDLEEVLCSLRIPREDRVVVAERTLTTVSQQSGFDDVTRLFLLGYIVSHVGPGSLDHVGLLTPHLSKHPAAMLWYGLCAGLSKNSELHSTAGGLGYRVLRDLLAEDCFLDKPRCDISIDELRVLASRDGKVPSFRRGSNAVYLVEIYPCINTAIGVSPRPPEATALDESQQSELRRLVAQLVDALRSADEVTSRLSTLSGAGDSNKNQASRRRSRKKS